MPSQREPWTDTFKQFLTNLDAPYPLPTKMWLLARNVTLRVLRLQTCCGHRGEPGC